MKPPPREEGFTLLEALVALAIIAIAAAGIMGAIERHIDTVRGLEQRAAARWVAENRLVELTLGGKDQAPQIAGGDVVEMLGSKWQVATTTRSSADPDMRAVEVAVGPVGKAPLIRMQGFVDAGTITP